MNPYRLAAIGAGLLSIVAATKGTCQEPPADATATSPAGIEFFEKKIRPVLSAHCYECHSAGAVAKKQLKANLLVDSREALLKGGDSGPAIVPGNVDDSPLIAALRYESFEMPPKGKLPDTVIADFEAWIRMGAPDPRRATGTAQRKELDIASGRRHWSYQLPQPHALPAITNTAWPLDEIDVFLLAAQEARDLKPGPEADRAVLVRRLYFDLLGLPPPPEVMDALVEDPAPDAIERLVDRLLGSPRFGERWGRHWLDVARFAESLTLRGFVMPEAWRYRDYVIESFNRDRPFDRFVQEQVAGDLLNADSLDHRRSQLVATSFLVLGNTNLEEQDKQQLEMDVVDEQLDVISKAFLAQTVTCARCHDHKFDPIPTRDYYSLAGILKGSRVLEHANVSKWLELPLPVDPPQEAVYQQQEAAIADLQSRIKAAKQAIQVAVAGKSPNSPASPAIIALKDLAGIVVDDSQAKRVGEWKFSQFSQRYIGDGYLHDLDAGKGEKTLTFLFEPPQAQRYEVRLAYTPGTNRAAAAPVTVFSADGEKTLLIDQRETPPIDGRFVSLGVYRFEPNGQSFVIVDNRETRGHVIADAVQFLPLDGMDSVATQPTPSTADPVAADEKQRFAAAEHKRAEDAVKKLEGELKQLTERGPKRPLFMSVRDEKSATDIAIHIRGSASNLGDKAPRGFLQVATYDAQPMIAAGTSGRAELGEWLTSRNNPLTARVFANRAWHWLFGAGLVRTTDNFGTTGERPSHPELLDHLAVRFMDDDWSTKALVRRLVLSRGFRLSSPSIRPGSRQSLVSVPSLSTDPENRLLAHANRRRLDAECLLDAVLWTSGQLRYEQGGPTIKPGTSADYGYEHTLTRRAVYWPVLRNALPELLEAFDFADPSVTTGGRNVSTVAPQALFLLNHPFIRSAAGKTAAGLLDSAAPDDAARVTQAYRLVLGRTPNAGEQQLAQQYIGESPQDPAARLGQWTQFVQALYATLEFRYVD